MKPVICLLSEKTGKLTFRGEKWDLNLNLPLRFELIVKIRTSKSLYERRLPPRIQREVRNDRVFARRTSLASLAALVQHGRRCVVLVDEVQHIVVAEREGHVAQQDEIAPDRAFELQRKGLPISFFAQDGTGFHVRFNRLAGNLDQQVSRVGPVAAAYPALGISS